MKSILLKLFKISLIIGLIFLVLLLLFALVVGFKWPLWVVIFLGVGFIGLVFGFFWVKKLLQRRREQKFVHQVIDQEDAYSKSLGAKERKNSKELQVRWKESIDTLRHSHLRKYGNPLYVLPWYMVIGESGSGKTTAIHSAQLASPFSEVTKTSGISGTRNCDWWFFEQAIIIDTAGRYAIPVDEGRDKEEWQKFLDLLAKYRKREPLNGLIVTVSAERLMDKDTKKVELLGASIRRRIDELMRVLGAKSPIYILVTKCDLVKGMTQFCELLGDKGAKQAMGYVNEAGEKDYSKFCKKALKNISNRLKDARMFLIHKTISSPQLSGLLLFPEEFDKIRENITSFFKGAFQENPYQETPHIRGLFFSSGRQEGTPYSHFLNELGLIGDQEVLPGTNKGLFLHDFFSKILPRDRGLSTPTQRTLEWSRLTKNLGLTSFIAIVIALCGILSFSFVNNLKVIQDISKRYSTPGVLRGEVLEDIHTLDKFKDVVVTLEKKNKSWWTPRLGLYESKRVQKELKIKFCKQFNEGFLIPFDTKLKENVTQFNKGTEPQMIGANVSHIVRRIHLLKARMEGEDLNLLKAHSQPAYDAGLMDQNMMLGATSKVTDLYLYYLIWRNDTARLQSEMGDLQKLLEYTLKSEDVNLDWLIYWAGYQPDLKKITMEHFWGVEYEKKEGDEILPAFTTEGEQWITQFIAEIESALYNPLIIEEYKPKFEEKYYTLYKDAWFDFSKHFAQMPDRLKDQGQWKHIAARVGTEQGPYFSFFKKMDMELKVLEEKADPSPWIQYVENFSIAQKNARDGDTSAKSKGGIQKSGIIQKATRKVKTQFSKAERATGFKAKSLLNPQEISRSANAFSEFEKSLGELTVVASSRNVSFKIASALYSQDLVTGQSVFAKAVNSLERLNTTLIPVNKGLPVMEKLSSGPIHFLHEYVNRETACHLNKLWEEKVLFETQDISDELNMNQALMGDGGYAVNFIKGPAKPFIERTIRKGYYGKKVLGRRINFDKTFFRFLTKGSRAAKPVSKSYSVTIKAYPTSADRNAHVIPHETILKLECAEGPQNLVNLNYRVGKTFDWSPQSCGDVTFTIKVGNLSLVKKYTGRKAFPKFLNDFKKGTRRFYPKDFPNEVAALKRMGIHYIVVQYQLQGHQPVLKLLYQTPESVPASIASCWDSY